MTSHEVTKALTHGYPFGVRSSKISGRNILNSLPVALSLLLLGGLLSSCGASAEEEALKANCERIFSYLKSVEDTPEIFENSSVADSDSVALLLGEQTRKGVEEKILSLFPFLDEMIVGRERNKQQTDSSYYSGVIYIIEKSLTGTDIEFPYSQEEMKVIATTSNNWESSVSPVATKIFGDYFELRDHQGCAVIDNEIENPNSEENTSVAFSRASDVYLNYASFLQAVRDCDVSGWHGGNKCQKMDYVSKPSTYTPSDELTPEEIEILAERERDSQSTNEGSSGYSDVSAGQVCNSLGAVVNTANYGELTCKLVFIGRLRTLAWMRS